MSLRDRLRRFERLERPRQGGPDGDERPSTEERFEDLGAGNRPDPPAHPVPAGAPAPAPSAGDRFAPPRPRPPELEERSDEEQPFQRCMRCETDSSRYARTCTTCGEELHTEAQRAYNEKLWAARQKERDELDQANAGRREAQARAEVEVAEARRLAATEMARQVGERERWRIESRDPWGGVPPYDPDDPYRRDPTPVGVRLLRAIQSPTWRLVAIGGLVLLVVVAALFVRLFPPLLILLVSVLVGLFAPRRRFGRRLWW